jgi:hypothetical protein
MGLTMFGLYTAKVIRFASMPHGGQRTTGTNIGAIGPVERSDYQMRHQALPYAPHDQTRMKSHRRIVGLGLVVSIRS